VEENLRHREGDEVDFVPASRIGIRTDGIRNVRSIETAIVTCGQS
jgi:hypothetical protein